MLVQGSLQAITRGVSLPAFTAAAWITFYRCNLHPEFYFVSLLQPGHCHCKTQAKTRQVDFFSQCLGAVGALWPETSTAGPHLANLTSPEKTLNSLSWLIVV